MVVLLLLQGLPVVIWQFSSRKTLEHHRTTGARQSDGHHHADKTSLEHRPRDALYATSLQGTPPILQGVNVV
jgi:hypothetical protein